MNVSPPTQILAPGWCLALRSCGGPDWTFDGIHMSSDLQLYPPKYPTFQTDNARSIPVARSRTRKASRLHKHRQRPFVVGDPVRDPDWLSQKAIDSLGSGPACGKVRKHLGHAVQVRAQRDDGHLVVTVATSLPKSDAGREPVAQALASDGVGEVSALAEIHVDGLGRTSAAARHTSPPRTRSRVLTRP